jgi:hypothetical protein
MASVVTSYLAPLLPSRLKPYTSSASGKATGTPLVKPSELAKAVSAQIDTMDLHDNEHRPGVPALEGSSR